jgi:hypothetical protein
MAKWRAWNPQLWGAAKNQRRGDPHIIAASRVPAIHTMLLSLVEFE